MLVTVNKLPANESTEEHFILSANWRDDNFDILLIQNELAWTGNATQDHLKELSQFLDKSVDEYLAEVKTALSTPGGMTDFSYHISESDKQFVLKKLLVGSIRIKFGFIPLEQAPFDETVRKIFDYLLQQNSSLLKQVDTLQETSKRAAVEKTILMEKLVEYKKQKLEMEKTLYSQFVAVLNKKKQYSNQGHEGNGNSDTEASTSNRNSNHYDSDTEVDTDNEDKIAPGHSSGDDLFEFESKPTTSIPKRIGRKRNIEPLKDKPGPSVTKTKKPIMKCLEPDLSNSQDLWDDF